MPCEAACRPDPFADRLMVCRRASSSALQQPRPSVTTAAPGASQCLAPTRKISSSCGSFDRRHGFKSRAGSPLGTGRRPTAHEGRFAAPRRRPPLAAGAHPDEIGVAPTVWSTSPRKAVSPSRRRSPPAIVLHGPGAVHMLDGIETAAEFLRRDAVLRRQIRGLADTPSTCTCKAAEWSRGRIVHAVGDVCFLHRLH